MCHMNFVRGMGIGIAVGAGLGMMMTPRRRMHVKKSSAGQAIRAVTDVMDHVSDVMGL